MNEETNVSVNSIFGAQSRRGLVELRIDSFRRLLSPASARWLAMMLIEGAASAQGDETVMQWLDQKLGVPPHVAVAALREMRDIRAELWKRDRVEEPTAGEPIKEERP